MPKYKVVLTAANSNALGVKHHEVIVEAVNERYAEDEGRNSWATAGLDVAPPLPIQSVEVILLDPLRDLSELIAEHVLEPHDYDGCDVYCKCGFGSNESKDAFLPDEKWAAHLTEILINAGFVKKVE